MPNCPPSRSQAGLPCGVTVTHMIETWVSAHETGKVSPAETGQKLLHSLSVEYRKRQLENTVVRRRRRRQPGGDDGRRRGVGGCIRFLPIGGPKRSGDANAASARAAELDACVACWVDMPCTPYGTTALVHQLAVPLLGDDRLESACMRLAEGCLPGHTVEEVQVRPAGGGDSGGGSRRWQQAGPAAGGLSDRILSLPALSHRSRSSGKASGSHGRRSTSQSHT